MSIFGMERVGPGGDDVKDGAGLGLARIGL
jgi:hypothetical protein